MLRTFTRTQRARGSIEGRHSDTECQTASSLTSQPDEVDQLQVHKQAVTAAPSSRTNRWLHAPMAPSGGKRTKNRTGNPNLLTKSYRTASFIRLMRRDVKMRSMQNFVELYFRLGLTNKKTLFLVSELEWRCRKIIIFHRSNPSHKLRMFSFLLAVGLILLSIKYTSYVDIKTHRSSSFQNRSPILSPQNGSHRIRAHYTAQWSIHIQISEYNTHKQIWHVAMSVFNLHTLHIQMYTVWLINI